jgi:hypothetical protein
VSQVFFSLAASAYRASVLTAIGGLTSEPIATMSGFPSSVMTGRQTSTASLPAYTILPASCAPRSRTTPAAGAGPRAVQRGLIRRTRCPATTFSLVSSLAETANRNNASKLSWAGGAVR